MDINKATSLARALMLKHGVGYIPFTFHSYRSRPLGLKGETMFRVVNGVYLPTHISVSIHYAEVQPEEEFVNTVLHEIAHAKAGKYAGHGLLWQTEAIKLGINPTETTQSSVVPNWTLVTSKGMEKG